MQRKTGVLIFTHGSRLKDGNEIMVKLRMTEEQAVKAREEMVQYISDEMEALDDVTGNQLLAGDLK